MRKTYTMADVVTLLLSLTTPVRDAWRVEGGTEFVRRTVRRVRTMFTRRVVIHTRRRLLGFTVPTVEFRRPAPTYTARPVPVQLAPVATLATLRAALRPTPPADLLTPAEPVRHDDGAELSAVRAALWAAECDTLFTPEPTTAVPTPPAATPVKPTRKPSARKAPATKPAAAPKPTPAARKPRKAKAA